MFRRLDYIIFCSDKNYTIFFFGSEERSLNSKKSALVSKKAEYDELVHVQLAPGCYGLCIQVKKIIDNGVSYSVSKNSPETSNKTLDDTTESLDEEEKKVESPTNQ